MKIWRAVCITFGILMAIGAIICLVVGLVAPEDESMMTAMIVIAVLLFIGAFALIYGAIISSVQEKSRQKNIDDPTTIAHELLKEGADYERYIVYPVSADEKQKKAVADTVGAIALVTLGVGFFSVGAKDPVEVFVSEKGLVLNDRNFGYNDERFVRFPASTFRNVQFEDRGGKERVIISLSNYSDELIFDVPLKKKSAEEIRVSFLRPMRERLAVKSETAQDNSEQAVYSEFEEKEQADDAEAPIENSEE